ncbi:MAG TPA: glycosyltransferase [Thermoanaerobaculia bacterium]|nr:glycosyltransferase [Thermoanaerobaculia bacterium]
MKIIPRPAVTIITPVYNGAAYLEQAIESARRQTYEDWELLVINDGSTDATGEIAERCARRDSRIRYFANEANLGISRTRNRGLAVAEGTLVAMLDSDDLWLASNKLEAQVRAFERAGGGEEPLGVLGTWMIRIDERGLERQGRASRVSFPETDSDIRRSLLYRDHIAHSSVLFLKQAAIEAGGYDERLAIAEDHDLWLKIARNYALRTLPIYALGYRSHSRNITRTRALKGALEELKVISRHRREYRGFAFGFSRALVRLAWVTLRTSPRVVGITGR